MRLIFLVCFSINITSEAANGQGNSVASEQQSPANDSNENQAARLVEQIKAQKDPILRFIACLKHVVEINKYLLDSSNLPSISSSFADDPESEQEREKAIAKVAKNREKIETGNKKILIKQMLIKQMIEDLSKINPEYREQFNSVIDSLR